jgi:putative colanic acid biosynthesis acetyltransferase WcaF
MPYFKTVKPNRQTRIGASAPLDARLSNATQGGVSFPLSNRLYRLTFSITWVLLARWTPPPMRRWRLWLLRRFGATMSPTANVYGSARIWSPANLVVDDYATIGPRATVYSMGAIHLGAYAIISQGAHLCAGTHDIEDAGFQLRASAIAIGARAWVAAEAFVGPGVTVGEGAVLGARGCAMRDLEAWTVYTGNPACALRARRIRFDDSRHR